MQQHLLCLVLISLTASAGDRWYLQHDDNGLALSGYDVTSYFSDDGPIKGSPQWSTKLDGLTYHFSSSENRDRFKTDPQSYLPQCGGWCALACGADAATMGFGAARFPPDPENFKMIDGQLYLFAKLPGFDARAIWDRADQAQILARADSYWESRVKLAKRIGPKPQGMNPNAVMETAQFDFLIGAWDSRGKQMVDPDKQVYGPEYRGTWTAYYGWDGYAIYDDWKPVGAVGGSGPAIRSFDPLTRKWVMTYIPINSSAQMIWKMEGEFDDDGNLHAQFEAVDRRGRAIVQKVHFTDISQDHFSWRADRSFDGGETWILNFMVSQQTRIR